ncbi:MAG TPA: hypothetical protein VMT17_11740 [Anaeromyxobacteraceae bacterium]|nr:hypothetical protein [Anaeromyxobacteraceae bacterium]
MPTTCPIASPPAHPTFAQDILPALQQSCGARPTSSQTSSCHGDVGAPSHLIFATVPPRTAADVYADLVNATPTNAPPGYLRVAPGDPDHSWILAKITQDEPGGSGYGARMPYGAPDLCAATIQAFRNWIVDEAPP